MITITIYLDIIFLENLIMNSILLYATSIILKIKPKFIRVIIASAIGSIYAIFLYITNIKIYTSIISKIILSIIIVYVAFNPQTMKKLWKQLACFYLTSFLFGGVALYLIYFIKPQEIQIKNGMFAGEYVLKVILLGAILSFIMIKIALKFIKTKLTSKDMLCHLKVELGSKEVNTTAMIDTGNLVKEPITNTPVVIIETSLLYDILPKEVLNNLENILKGDLSNLPKEMQEKYIPKLRCIPFTSLGKQNGMLVGIKFDKITVKYEEETKTTNNIIIGLYDKSLTKRGEYKALIGIELI